MVQRKRRLQIVGGILQKEMELRLQCENGSWRQLFHGLQLGGLRKRRAYMLGTSKDGLSAD